MRAGEPPDFVQLKSNQTCPCDGGCPRCSGDNIIQTKPLENSVPDIQRRVRDRFVSCRRPTRAERRIVGSNPVGDISAADTTAINYSDIILEELRTTRRTIRRVVRRSRGWSRIPARLFVSDRVAVPLRRRFNINPNDQDSWTGRGMGTVYSVIRRLQAMRNKLNRGWIRYECLGPTRPHSREFISASRRAVVVCIGRGCRGGAWASSCHGVNHISFCEPFWSNRDIRMRANALLHEAYHILYRGRAHSGRVTNAYCYTLFFNDFFRMGEWRGATRFCPVPGRRRRRRRR